MKQKRKLTPHGKAVISIVIIFFTLVVIFFGTVSILKTLYPRRYSEFVEKECSSNNLQQEFIFAVIECESGFKKNAVSYMGAKGLMQIMPETFTWLQQLKGEELSEDSLFEPEIAIEYGCYFYALLIEQFGDEATAVAAYHAGASSVEKWLSDERYSADGKTLSDIPFESTKEYVKKVMKTKNIYEKLYN